METVSSRCEIIGRPATACITLGRPDFIRVPLPAARITTAIGVSVISWVRYGRVGYVTQKLPQRAESHQVTNCSRILRRRRAKHVGAGLKTRPYRSASPNTSVPSASRAETRWAKPAPHGVCIPDGRANVRSQTPISASQISTSRSCITFLAGPEAGNPFERSACSLRTCPSNGAVELRLRARGGKACIFAS